MLSLASISRASCLAPCPLIQAAHAMSFRGTKILRTQGTNPPTQDPRAEGHTLTGPQISGYPPTRWHVRSYPLARAHLVSDEVELESHVIERRAAHDQRLHERLHALVVQLDVASRAFLLAFALAASDVERREGRAAREAAENIARRATYER